MAKVFYDHLIMIDEVITEIELLEMEKDQKEQLAKMVDDTIHHRVITFILDVLPRQHHAYFLDKFHHMPYDLRLLDYVNDKIEQDIKSELILLGLRTKKEFLAEIKRYKKSIKKKFNKK